MSIVEGRGSWKRPYHRLTKRGFHRNLGGRHRIARPVMLLTNRIPTMETLIEKFVERLERNAVPSGRFVSNYGERVVPLDVAIQLVREAIKESFGRDRVAVRESLTPSEKVIVEVDEIIRDLKINL